MFKVLAQCALLLFALLSRAAVAEPITLKLAFFTSDQSKIYNIAVKPFVDAVNAHDGIKIETYASGRLARIRPSNPRWSGTALRHRLRRAGTDGQSVSRPLGYGASRFVQRYAGSHVGMHPPDRLGNHGRLQRFLCHRSICD